jgi:hypothetical protein
VVSGEHLHLTISTDVITDPLDEEVVESGTYGLGLIGDCSLNLIG